MHRGKPESPVLNLTLHKLIATDGGPSFNFVDTLELSVYLDVHYILVKFFFFGHYSFKTLYMLNAVSDLKWWAFLLKLF